VDGPDVDGHDVDFDNLLKRNRRFIEEERRRLEAYEHQCKAIDQLQRS
jgi:ferredoxin--NADP+ reductase